LRGRGKPTPGSAPKAPTLENKRGKNLRVSKTPLSPREQCFDIRETGKRTRGNVNKIEEK